METYGLSKELQAVDLGSLCLLENRHYLHHIKQHSKIESLQIIINSVEGDHSQLSPQLARIADKQVLSNSQN